MFVQIFASSAWIGVVWTIGAPNTENSAPTTSPDPEPTRPTMHGSETISSKKRPAAIRSGAWATNTSVPMSRSRCFVRYPATKSVVPGATVERSTTECPGRSNGSRSSSAPRMSRMSISMCENDGVPSVMTMCSAAAASATRSDQAIVPAAVTRSSTSWAPGSSNGMRAARTASRRSRSTSMPIVRSPRSAKASASGSPTRPQPMIATSCSMRPVRLAVPVAVALYHRRPMKRSLITGITGQDGSYLAEQLLEKGYEVHGIIRRSSSFNTERIDPIYRDLHEEGVRLILHHGDLSDSSRLVRLLYELQPDEVYHLGAQSHVRVSFDVPEYTADVTGMGTLRLLEAMRDAGVRPRFYQASSSEMYGATPPPQSERTAFHPRSPYAVAKVMGFWATVNYRESYGLFACNGILFNHESPRRGETFVTRKITRALARIQAGLQDKLFLGNLDAKRDWGYAPDYTDAMWRMLQQDEPDDFVVATGEMHTVREFLEEAAGCLGLDWEGVCAFDERYLRPAEVDALQGDATKAREKLGWEPTVTFKDLVRIMVDADVKALEDELAGRNVRL